ncbi:GNAT family N-acetyltransferase [Roseibium aggregatum]|uniref:GNAT family N-acetyltransferase n=1 Tax=Roseibium aggregatum TaxID=187304 RepID=A0A939ED41_9HYPH|nr:GNAT family N-acetyltransferase [Roseibium aggregatum]MBN9669893.1 GNAT family N-acetyltransferase [Roseibium aggregatum]
MTATQDSFLEVILCSSFDTCSPFEQELSSALPVIPFGTPHWLDSWSRTLGKKYGLDIVIAIGSLGDATVVILPLALERTAGIARLSFLGHQNGNQNTGVWDAEFYASVTSTQINAFLSEICRRAGADLVTLHNVPEVWQGRPHPLVLETATQSPSPIFVRSLPSDFEELFRETHGKSSRKSLLRKQRHLQAFSEYKVVKASTAEEIRNGLAAFLDQRAKRAATVGIPNAFGDPEGQEFLERLLGLRSSEAAPGDHSLDLWYLETGGAIRATYLCAERSGTIYTYSNSIAHDELLQYSPGIVLVKEIIAYACAAPHLDTIDLGLGEERYKTDWAEAVRLNDSLFAATWKGRLLGDLEKTKIRTKAAIRNSQTLWPLVRRLRKWRAEAGKRAQ